MLGNSMDGHPKRARVTRALSMHARFNECAADAPDQPPDLLLFGDPHGNFVSVVRAVRRLQPKAIILLGDLTAARPLHIELASILDETEIWFIHGNHDTDREDYWLNIGERLVGTPLEDRNLHGRRVVIGDKLVIGLGGIFRGSVWMPTPECTLQSRQREEWYAPDHLMRHQKPAERWRGGLSLKHRSTIFPAELDRLVGWSADILVSHESPLLRCGGFDARWRYGFRVMNDLAEHLNVKLAVHGHHHEDIDYQHQEPSKQGPSKQERRKQEPEKERQWNAFGVNQDSCLVVHF